MKPALDVNAEAAELPLSKRIFAFGVMCVGFFIALWTYRSFLPR